MNTNQLHNVPNSQNKVYQYHKTPIVISENQQDANRIYHSANMLTKHIQKK